MASYPTRCESICQVRIEVRRLMGTAEGYDARGRQLSGDLAAPGIHIPEQYGGAGFGMVGALHRVTEELSGALLCARYFSTGCSRLTPFCTLAPRRRNRPCCRTWQKADR
jgi:hypothetical protein